MTFPAFKRAVAAALNAANSRVLAKKKNHSQGENSKPEKSVTHEEEHFLREWTLRDDEDLLDEDDDNLDANTNQNDSEMVDEENSH